MATVELAPTSALSKISKRPAIRSPEQVVRERIVRLAELIRKDGAAYPLSAPLVNTWVDVFARARISAQQLDAAFDKAERSLKFWPAPAEILALVTVAEETLADEAAERKWCQVREFIRLHYNPDIPSKNAPRITERTQRAINAAGGLAYLADCDRESLQWRKKEFIEAYLRWDELEQDQYLLPPGKVKNLLAGTAQAKALPAPVLQVGRSPISPPEKIIDMTDARAIRETPRVVDFDGRRADMKKQAEQILERFAKH